ncbi:SubName: Full=Uncharacterized protein {ECO:0000313/EMBL:CCA68507.1} [Serendipita indica DSM 11827]|nr:SubName: Full=Uncharacterized protein {ECO:0000313/EMBL:CCA68507.1} [Serendipita indica DSM 11827]
MSQSTTFDLHTPPTLPSPTVQTPSEHSPYSMDAEPNLPALDSVDVDSSVLTEIPTNVSRRPKQPYNCRDLPDSESEEEEEDPDILRPNCRGRWFTCLGADYGPKDHKWYGIHPRLGMRYGQLDETQQKLYEDLGPDYEHEEAALTLLEKVKLEGLEGVKPETFKAMMIQCKTAKKWKLGVRRCAKPPDTYSHMKSHLLTTMHAPIGYECPDCHMTILQEPDMKRHLEESHAYTNLPGSLEEIRKALNRPRRKAPRLKVSQPPGSVLQDSQAVPKPSSGSVVVGNYYTVQVKAPITHALTHPRQHNTIHHSRPAPYHMDTRPVHVPRHSALRQTLPQGQPDNFGYAPPVYAPNQLPDEDYVGQTLASDKECLTFSGAMLPTSRVATNTVNYLLAVPSVMYTSALQSAGYPMYTQVSRSTISVIL